MTAPNFDQLQTDQNPPPDNQQQSNHQQQQSNTQIGGYDPRLDAFMDEQRRVNNQIVESLQRLSNPPQQQRQEPEPTFTEDQFRENPAGVIGTIVERRIAAASDRLRNDVNSQLAPINNYIVQNQRTAFADNLINQLKNNPQFSRLSEPAVAAAFKQGVSGYTGEMSYAAAANIYIYALGYLSQNPQQFQQNNTSPINTPPINTPPQDPPPSAHIRPDAAPVQQRNGIRLPALDENQNRIMRERGWSHARAAYCFKLISPADYQKIEPTGKLIEGL